MKKITIAIITTLVVASIAYAGVKCNVCGGTGWRGQFRCTICGGDGEIGN